MTRFEAQDRVGYAVANQGAGLPLLLIHGFTGSATTWRPFADRWPGVRQIAPDLLGHGDSDAPPDPSRYSIVRTVADLAGLLDSLEIERAAVLGYSLGGRIALRFALAHPQRTAALFLESASPGIESPEERRQRIASDAELADRIEQEGIEHFVDHWQALPLWESQSRLAPEIRARLRRQRLAQRPEGLANSLRGCGAGTDQPALADLARLEPPLTLVAGALDEKYVALARQMAARSSGAHVEIVENAGHAVHLEQPDRFAELVARFAAPLSVP